MNKLRLGVFSVVLIGIAFIAWWGRTQQPAGLARITPPHAAGSAPTTQLAIGDLTQRPAPGRWRLAPPETLDRICLPLAHILVAHADAEPGFSLGHDMAEIAWLRRAHSPTQRTREQARESIEAIARRLQDHPEELGAVAAVESDDYATRQLRGEAGCWPASHLHPLVLDAVAPLRAGQVSQIVETSYGFHLWRLGAPPPAQVAYGRRVVVPYQGASRGDGANVILDRSQAEALAARIARLAANGGSDLLTASKPYVLSLDAEMTGSLGGWSARALGHDVSGAERELAALAQLPVGGRTPPFDSRVGFQILERTAAEPSTRYAYDAVVLRFDPEAKPSATHSQARIEATLRQALAQRDRVEAFETLQRQTCCAAPVQWSAGFSGFDISAVLRALPMGGIADQAVRRDNVLLWVRRQPANDDPAPIAEAFELPKPEAPDLPLLVERGDGKMLAAATRALAEEATQQLALAEPQASAFKDIFQHLASELEPSPPGPARRHMLDNATRAAESLLGPHQFAECERYMQHWAASRMLGTP